jgi:ADP-ribosylation factor GTPase-activating protein 1
MDQATAKRTLNELIKREDLKNKNCADCGNPNPQWASVRCVKDISEWQHRAGATDSFAIFICLQCAGHHRGYGVHIRYAVSTLCGINLTAAIQLRTFSLDGHLV